MNVFEVRVTDERDKSSLQLPGQFKQLSLINFKCIHLVHLSSSLGARVAQSVSARPWCKRS